MYNQLKKGKLVMEKIKRLSTAGTVICIVSMMMYVALALFLYFGRISDALADFTNGSMDKLRNVSPDSPSAGYEVIAYLAGGALGLLGSIFLFAVIFLLIALALYQFPAIISGIIVNRKYKKAMDKTACINSFKVDGFVKAIMNGIAVVSICSLIIADIRHASISDILILLIAAWNYVAVFALSILQIKKINEGQYLAT